MSSKRIIYLVGLAATAGLLACTATPVGPGQSYCRVGESADGTCLEWVSEPTQDTLTAEAVSLSPLRNRERTRPSRLK